MKIDMMIYRNCYLLFLALFFAACETEIADPPALLQVEPPTHFNTEVQYPDTLGLRSIVFRSGQQTTEDLPTYVFTGSRTTIGALGSTLIISAIHPTQIPVELYRLQFWSNDLPGDRKWTAQELDEFFEVGKVFDFGAGESKVDIGLFLPRRETADISLSRPSYLANPSGGMLVESVEDFDYPIYERVNQQFQSYGKLIHCSFNGEVGRYDYAADQADGDPNFFQTDEVVELIDGKVVFYVEYEKI